MKKTGYELSRIWFDWCFENRLKIKPNHTALYFFCIEHWNRMGQINEFGLPTTMAKEAIGIASYNTYISTLNDLVEWGFIEMVQKSKNQYSANIVALSNNDKATNKALDKALIKHATKQSESTIQSIDSINKQLNKEQRTKNIEERKKDFASTLKEFIPTFSRDLVKEFYDYWTEPNKSNTKMRYELEKTWSVKLRLDKWAKNQKLFNKNTEPERKPKFL